MLTYKTKNGIITLYQTKGEQKMTNEFKDYYKTVQEHGYDMVNEIYDDLLEELKESYGYKYETWERLNEAFLAEYNNYISISLREAVEILEQSTRLVTDQAMYVNAGDCKEQVQAMAYWTYRTDLIAEFKLALNSKLQEDIPVFQSKANQLEDEVEELAEQIKDKESLLEDLEQDKENAQNENNKETVKEIEKTMAEQITLLEALERQLVEMEEDLEEAQNLLDNAQSFN
ncbi:MAG TPA: hypothetical protein VK590_07535 [Saprospiraceae bacterium]|nr:hypothetical protein [Saprospiraceae bacterium]